MSHHKGIVPLSRRHMVTGLTAFLATACHGERARPESRSRPRNARPLTDFGVDRFSARDQWAQLKQAFAAAHDGGFDLLGDPDATYRHDGPLTLDGVSFDGQGCTLSALSNRHQVLRCVGSDFRIANLRLLGAATARTSDNWDNGIWIGDEGDQAASDFLIENVTVDAVAPGRGMAAAGFMFDNAHRGRVLRPVARRCLADGIHVTDGSSDLWFASPLSEATGDDGFAVVSYVRQRKVCRNIRVMNGISRDSAARGFTVVGGSDIFYERPHVERAAAAGIYLYGEEPFDTFGVARCEVTAPVILDCVTGRNMPGGFNQGAITIGGREGSDRVNGEVLGRGVTDCVIRNPVIRGVGHACRTAIAVEQFAIRSRITDAKLDTIVSNNPALSANGIEIGGQDIVFERPEMTDIGGLAIVLNHMASGTCRVTAPRVDGSRLRGGPVDSVIYAENAPDLKQLIISGGLFRHGPKRLAVSLLPAGKIRLLDNRVG